MDSKGQDVIINTQDYRKTIGHEKELFRICTQIYAMHEISARQKNSNYIG